ncbi:FGGY-family carbohydrate kinase [Sphaerisporangium sp. NPDC051011]|uniref:FGGY-family carbohydrate kinase n=1 Tax=Sphaerisporangium sp. NPDC051011 TaxID=3155792 RepID=UPI0033BFE53A
MTERVLAIDIGSSSLRAGIVEQDGSLVVQRQLGYDFRGRRSPEGTIPAEPVRRLLRQALESLNLRGVRTVAVSSLWHSVLVVDARDEPLTEVYTWESTGPDASLDGLYAHLDAEDYRRRTGSYVHSSYPMAAFWHIRDRIPSDSRVTDLPSWLLRRTLGLDIGWSGDMAAGSGMWAQDDADWDTGVLNVLDLDPARLGPAWVDPAPVGSLGRALGLADTLVLPVFGDGLCSSVGVGAVGDHEAAVTVGTSGGVRMILDSAPAETVPRGLWRYRLPSGPTAVGGAASNAGNLLEWLRNTLGIADPLAFAYGAPPPLDGLVAVPDLAGQRGPDYRIGATASLRGLRAHHDRDDIARAFVVGALGVFVSLTELLLRTRPDLNTLIASGGVISRSPIFAQLLADAVGRPVRTSREREGSLLGAAILGLGSRPAPGHSALFQPRAVWTETIRAATSTDQRNAPPNRLPPFLIKR